MSTFTQPVNYGWTPLMPAGTREVGIESEEFGNRDQVIVIDDIEDIAVLRKQDTYSSSSFIALLGVIPTPALAKDVQIKLSLSILLSPVLTIWISNSLALGMFMVLAVAYFVTCLILVKSKTFREKKQHLQQILQL